MGVTSINIKGDDKVFKYVVDYSTTDNYWSTVQSNAAICPQYTKKYDRVDIFTEMSEYVKFTSNWIPKDEYIESVTQSYNDSVSDQIICLGTDYFPHQIKVAKLSVYFPRFSVDTYTHTLYMLTVNTWVNGKYVYLGSYVLNRMDALALPSIKEVNGERYYEYISVDIVDPRDIVYGDDWKEFRNRVCGEPLIENNYNYNNTGSLLNFTLYPVEKIDETYISKDHYHGGQNSINISEKLSDYFGISVDYDFDKNGIFFRYNINFNDYYKSDIDSYIKETYNIIEPHYDCKMIIVGKNDENVDYYESQSKIFSDKNKVEPIIFRKNEVNASDTYGDDNHFSLFDTWNNWKQGLVIMGVFSIYNHNDEDREEILTLLSNEIPITKELYRYLLIDDTNINYINLDNIDMKHYNISAVNKIVNNVIQVDKPEDSKSNIIQPIFFRTRDLNSLIIHPEVTENICINLDAYKSKVNQFILQIEGIKFRQISSTTQGVIFKVIGNNLPKAKDEGIYYILNDDLELVTSGKYRYES